MDGIILDHFTDIHQGIMHARFENLTRAQSCIETVGGVIRKNPISNRHTRLKSHKLSTHVIAKLLG